MVQYIKIYFLLTVIILGHSLTYGNEVQELDLDYDFSHVSLEFGLGLEGSMFRYENRNELFVDSLNDLMESTKDKGKHFYAGRVIGILSESFCEQMDYDNPVLCRISGASLAGVLKEVYDSTGRGNVELMDAVATGAGSLYFEIKF